MSFGSRFSCSHCLLLKAGSGLAHFDELRLIQRIISLGHQLRVQPLLFLLELHDVSLLEVYSRLCARHTLVQESLDLGVELELLVPIASQLGLKELSLECFDLFLEELSPFEVALNLLIYGLMIVLVVELVLLPLPSALVVGRI